MPMIHCKECGEEISKSAKVCPKCGKKLKNGVLRVVLGIILVFIGLGIIFGGDTSNNNNTTTTQTNNSNTQITQPKEKFTLISSEMVTDSFGTCYIEGTIQNNTNKSYIYAQVTFNLYDSEGNQLGTAMDNINNFQPNGTWKYKAIGLTTDNVARYEFVNITNW